MLKESSPIRNAIVVVIDRLGSGFLGPYGNTWIETPAMNQLASESVLFENAIADSNDLDRLQRSYWSGVHAMCRRDSPQCSLGRLIERAGYRAVLLTDDELLLKHPLAEDFGEHVALGQAAQDQIAASIEETRFAQFTLAAIELLTDAAEPGLFWLHAQGPSGWWDAPAEFAERFRDEEDPEAYSGVVPPRFNLESDYDPDEILRIVHAYAAQVAMIDACLGSLFDAIAQHPLADDTLVIMTSPRGYPLGEHGRVGAGGRDLFGETLQVPLLLRLPVQQRTGMRLGVLTQPTDIYATLAAWFELGVAADTSTGRDLLTFSQNEQAWTRDAAFALGNNERAVRTPAWSLHEVERAESGVAKSLYVKPDDRWEANEVADRCGEVPDQLSALIDEFARLVNQGGLVKLEPLSRELIDGIS